jgi:hypothetical protein
MIGTGEWGLGIGYLSPLSLWERVRVRELGIIYSEASWDFQIL